MAQLVSSRLVVHSTIRACFIPAASAQSVQPARLRAARAFSSTVHAPRELLPSFFSRSFRHADSSANAQRRREAHATRAPGLTSSSTHANSTFIPTTAASSAQHAPDSAQVSQHGIASAGTISTDQPLSTSSYAPASNDPSLIETDLAALQGQISPAPTSLFRPVQTHSFSTLLKTYQQLSKSRLTFLVVLTAMAPYALCPAALSSAGLAAGSSLASLAALAAGTALCSASANSFNQLLESPYDAQMTRTRARPLPRRAISSLHAFSFAVGCGLSGTSILYFALNPLTAALGLANVVLYAGIYTPMKRLSIVNTWVGSAVGAIPPLMGWTAVTNSLLDFPSDAPGWVLAALLFAWQFPHFNSLAQSLRAEYARGGYRMMSVLNPALNRRVSLRYALLLLPLCSLALPLAGNLDWTASFLGWFSGASSDAATHSNGSVVEPVPYALLSLPINGVMIHAAYRFWRQGTDKAARWCFWVSLVHLPAIMLLAMACKRDLWNGIGEAAGLGTVRLPQSASSASRAAGLKATGDADLDSDQKR
ncbi:Protoheme IX farnesyltransferase, mitochondrial [Tilletia horrida]|uniref:Protoheme IX farnesyltransferase, mitochondrial n=1 Tax=Tilletia horrida TaxID=155126 RepID=A0AAN6GWG9_9BASI|nr:Protoheme IX farnesyltransferase, mitochondrial [Tilletia horrida]KAK0556393.1 Protoheme IX farnesyltransferase, mitochondrial [Tilletia horrida]KAK0569293.1 Protoheme IX farnesyltransferase, mitochondrial [Tilletia horrida]